MTSSSRDSLSLKHRFVISIALAILISGSPPGSAQRPGLEDGEWRYLGGDSGSTRSAPMLDQINADNFSDLEVAFTWVGIQQVGVDCRRSRDISCSISEPTVNGLGSC